ncbi:hypothetical protein E1286_43770, partial [Nonomuraea terrae]
MRRPLLSLMTVALVLPACSAPESPPAPPVTKQPATKQQPATKRPQAATAAPGRVDLSAYDAGRSRPVADPLYPAYGDPSIDVLHYDLALAWKPGARTLSGTATLTLRAARPISRVRLDFGRALKVDAVKVNDVTIEATRKGDDLTVPLPEALEADEGAVVTVRYHGRPKPVDAEQRREDISMLGFHVGE